MIGYTYYILNKSCSFKIDVWLLLHLFTKLKNIKKERMFICNNTSAISYILYCTDIFYQKMTYKYYINVCLQFLYNLQFSINKIIATLDSFYVKIDLIIVYLTNCLSIKTLKQWIQIVLKSIRFYMFVMYTASSERIPILVSHHLRTFL